MKTDKEIKVIIFSSKENFLESTNLFDSENTKIVGFSSDFMRIKSYMVLYKGATIISDEETIGSRLEEVLSYAKNYKCGVIYCSKKYVPNNLMKDYGNFDVIYSHQYPRFDDFIITICKRTRILIDKINLGVSNDTNVKSNVSGLEAVKNKSLVENNNKISSNVQVKTQNTSSNSQSYELYSKNKMFKKVIAIGASTGGPDMILKILKTLPSDFKVPVFVVQHMPETFTKMFADRLNKECKVNIVEANNGDPVLGGCVYIAPGGKQMTISETKGEFFIKVQPHDKNYVNNPSVDVMFDSVCSKFGANIIAVILTGMGKDGAKGMLNIKNQGGYTIGQDAKSSVVYGMQRVAFEMGAVKIQLSIDDIGKHILSIL